MTTPLDHTHDPAARSWIESANSNGIDFPIQNLPFGVFVRPDRLEATIGVAIGDFIFDLRPVANAGLFRSLDEEIRAACCDHTLNRVMSLSKPQRSLLRKRIFELLQASAEPEARSRAASFLVLASEAEMLLPAAVGDYTDFYASIHHATNVGSMFRPDNALLPNYTWVPIGYHGRASSLVVSGTKIRRPAGQIMPDGAAAPVYAPSRRLDYELEIGAYVATSNSLGDPVPIAKAHDHLFGLSLVNDWSARDIQAWEYQPLGPFLGKSFATSLSPWVVTLEALAPFRAAATARTEGPAPLPYLFDHNDQAFGALDLQLEVLLSTAAMRAQGLGPQRLSSGNFRDMYWTLAQMLTHHASNGCNLRSGDLLASGTVSGIAPESRGCLLELSWKGTKKILMPTGEQRTFLEDGDEVILRGWCEAPGRTRIGFGECRGEVIASI